MRKHGRAWAFLGATVLANYSFAATRTPAPKPADPTPGEPLVATMGQRQPVHVRVARGQATLIRLPDGQRVMNVYGGDKGDGGVWSVDAGKVPTRFLAVKPKEVGVHTTLHVISNSGQEISFFLQEITGKEAQFDAEVDADPAEAAGSSSAAEIKWVPADEVISCKRAVDNYKIDSEDAQKKARAEAAAEVAAYQEAYPKKLFFGYQWDDARAARLGFLGRPWSDDRFTYFRSTKVLALYEINEDGKPSLIQYTYADGVYTVSKILYDGYFAIGTKKHNELIFHRERS